MRKAFIAIVAAAGFLFTIAASAASPIEVAASNWKFTPAEITLHTGRTQVLRLTSNEGVHGIQSDDLGIPLTTILPNKTVDVSVTPKKTGAYLLHCAIVCGTGHADMALKINVVSP